MPTIGKLIEDFESYAPLSVQEDFDNCGLLYGEREKEITGVLVTLDTNEAVVNEAVAKGCNLIIEHHPTLFTPIKQFDMDLPKHRALVAAIKADVAIYSAHTSVDYTQDGLNDAVIRALGCKEYAPIDGIASNARIGTLAASTTLAELEKTVSVVFDDNHVASVGKPWRRIERIAVINGGGGGHESELLNARAAGADAFLTSDFKYNVIRLAKDLDYAIIYFGHYESEFGFISLVIKKLAEFGYTERVFGAECCYKPYN